MKVSATLKGEKDSFGRRTVYIRVAQGLKRSFEATAFKVLDEQFKKGLVVKHPQANLFNAHIRKLIVEKEQAVLSGKLKKFPDADFFTYYNACLFEWETTREVKDSTLTQYRLELNKITGFRSSFKLSDIDHDFLRRYKTYCYSLGNEPNTVWKSFKLLRKVVLKAVREKIIEESPFKDFDFPKYKDPKKVFLTREQVDKIEAFAGETENESLKYSARWFLVGCYTGISFADMARFSKKENIRGGRLLIHRQKTDEPASMPLAPKIKTLLEHLDYQPYKYTGNAFREHLEKIRKACEIPQHITVHTARHTFATMAASAGISQEVTAKLLGQKDLKVTAIYYKLVNKRIDDEYGTLFD